MWIVYVAIERVVLVDCMRCHPMYISVVLSIFWGSFLYTVDLLRVVSRKVICYTDHNTLLSPKVIQSC